MDPTESAELELVRRVAAGEQDAFLILYDRYAARVHALTLHVLGDPMLAEEATQDTFLKLWSRARTFQPERGSLAVWLLTIARRTALDRVRLEGRRPLLSDGRDPDTVWQLIPDGSADGADARWQSLRFAVRALPAEQRKAIELAYYQGMSHSEIAAELGWPVGTVKTRIRAAMQGLRRAWLDEGTT